MGKSSSAKATASKYFKYAMGETLLVVIGILIALQINNWNENRKTKAEQQIFLKSIKQDLIADTTYLNQRLRKIDSSYQILQNQSLYVNRISSSKDSLINFMKNRIDLRIIGFDGFNNNTYESMKTSGKLELLGKSIKEQLHELSILHNSSQNRHRAFREDYIDNVEDLYANYPIPMPMSFIKNTSQNEFIWDNVSRKDIILTLNSWGTSKALFYANTIKNLKSLEEKTKSVLELIENENA